MDDPVRSIPDLTLLRQQDATAFAKLVHEHERAVVGLAHAMGLGGADVEDAAAEAFSEIYKALPRFHGRSALRTWIYQIAARTIWRVRKSIRHLPRALIDENTPDTSSPSPLEAAEISNERTAIWAAVARLEHRQATAVELFYGRDCSVEEVAEVLACPVGTVKTLLFRARASLRQTFKQRRILP